jgi:predicted RNA-binding Zn ribbon-like protein
MKEPEPNGEPMLPASDWPSDRPAPRSLELVRRFCNTINCDNGADRFDSATGLADWMVDQGRPRFDSTVAQRQALIELRETVREIAVAHQFGRETTDAARRLARLVDDVTVRMSVADDGFALVPAGRNPLDVLRGDIALAVAQATADGKWPRLKACTNCRWVLYDRSKNQSARWCSMQACGGRQKARAYRARLRTAP